MTCLHSTTCLLFHYFRKVFAAIFSHFFLHLYLSFDETMFVRKLLLEMAAVQTVHQQPRPD